MSGDAFDFSAGFASAADRIKGEAERRRDLVARAVPYNVGFLDDICRDILPNELVLIGARTGAGKTALATHIAMANAKQKKRVHYFALEAFEGEIEIRIKYQLVAYSAFRSNHPLARRLNFPDWYRGKFDMGLIEPEAEKFLSFELSTLNTYYRSTRFDVAELRKTFLRVQQDTDLIVLDHLHYVDVDDLKNEHSAMRDLVKTIRDVALAMAKPVVVVVHLRKRDSRKTLVPDLEDVMGASDITKIATTVVLLSRARDVSTAPGKSATYMHVPKSRMAGASPYVARLSFEFARQKYERPYILGQTDLPGEKWTPLTKDELPAWATNAANE